MKKLFCLLASATPILFACNKEEQPAKPYEHAGRVQIDVLNQVAGQELKLENTLYLNPNGDKFTVSRMSYFISGIVLNDAQGGKYWEESSMHLLDQADPSSMAVMLTNVPNSVYTSITFVIGVDSAKCHIDMLSYAPGSSDMVYSKEEGYIMVNMEGHSPSSNQPDGNVKYHITGYRGANNVVRRVTLPFPKELVVNDDRHLMVLNADMSKMFETPYLVDFRTMPIVTGPGENARIMADNYIDMFSVSAVN